MPKRVIVTGGNGFTGQYVIQELLKNNYQVTGIYHQSFECVHLNCKWYHLDLLDLEGCKQLIQSIMPDAVIHLAAQSNVILSQENPQQAIEANILCTLNLLEAIRLFNPKIKCILAGTSAVYHTTTEKIKLREDMPIKSQNIYALTKQFQEQVAALYIDVYQMNIICTRPFNYTGYGQKEHCFIPNLCRQVSNIDCGKREKNLSLGNISVYRDFLDVRDVACAYRLLLDAKVKSGIYNISSGKAVLLSDIVRYLCKKVGGQIKVGQKPSLMRKNDNFYIEGDNSLLKKSTGWSFHYSIFDTVDWIYEKMKEENE